MSEHLLGICGALRSGSHNRKLLHEAARFYAPAIFTEADLRLPLYDGDLEAAFGIPPEVQTLAGQIAAASVVVIATPEYNKSIPGVLKNALDWVSRVKTPIWRDKPVAIVSAAGGREGGVRSQFALRLALVPLRARVLAGPEVALGDADNAFDAEHRLIDPRYRKALTELMQNLRRAAS